MGRIAILLVAGLWLNNLYSRSSGFSIDGRVEGISSGFVYVIDIEDKDTIGKAVINNYVFLIQEAWPGTSRQVIPALLVAVQSDRAKSVSCPIAVEQASISLLLYETEVPHYSGTPLQEKFSKFVQESNELNANLFDRVTGDIVDSVQNELTFRTEQFYLQNKGTAIDPFLSLIIADIINRKLADPTDFKSIPRMCEDSSYTKTIYEQAICDAIANYTKTWEGANPLEITGKTSSNEDFRLTNLIGSKIIILDFWASWCGPCIKEMPSLKTLYDTLDIEIVGISIDRRQHDWITALNKHQLPWINIRDEHGDIAKAYNVTAVPTKLVIDKNGTIISRNPDSIELFLKTLLNK